MNKIMRNIMVATAMIVGPLYAQDSGKPDPKPINLSLSQLRPIDDRNFDASDIWNVPPPSGIEWLLYSNKSFPNKYTPIDELEKSYLSYKFLDIDGLTGKVFFNKIPSWHIPESYQISIGFQLRID